MSVLGGAVSRLFETDRQTGGWSRTQGRCPGGSPGSDGPCPHRRLQLLFPCQIIRFRGGSEGQ
ncbi:MAG: hypothetical protein BWY17_01208 [Deltaproteobacteria bacterium ADurb.Bin207]|jgi:hypothetical protein|nr:MAG: hypothetical protein BWY17_01208 [Deltaproteobacteria bacterium ADurb.Bin207]